RHFLTVIPILLLMELLRHYGPGERPDQQPSPRPINREDRWKPEIFRTLQSGAKTKAGDEGQSGRLPAEISVDGTAKQQPSSVASKLNRTDSLSDSDGTVAEPPTKLPAATGAASDSANAPRGTSVP